MPKIGIKAEDLMDIAVAGATGLASELGKAAGKNLKRKTPDQVEKILDANYRSGEMVERKRLPPAYFRLHAAKYLQMDKVLKSLFFPLRTLRNFFGLSSYSDCNRTDAEDLLQIAKNVSGVMRTKGNYRGVAFFTVRNTDLQVNPTSSDCLNADPKAIGGIRASDNSYIADIDSIYRPYHNGPCFSGVASAGQVVFDGSQVNGAKQQVLTSDDSKDQTQVRDLSMGINLSHIEKAALNGMCYADPVVANGRLANPSSPVLQQENTELLPGQNALSFYQNSPWINTDAGSETYNYQVANGVVRIVDGSLEMDIMNTENTPCVVEVVIHSKKKNNLSKQKIWDQFHMDYERLNAAYGTTSGFTAADANLSGGWQTFYDPEVPLMKLPKSATVYQYVTEVHRSHHILAPGQSKLVSIKLGSLWYKLSNKNDLHIVNPTGIGEGDVYKGFLSYVDNVGTLFVSLGHSGFNCPQGIQAVLNGPEGSKVYNQAFMSPQTDFATVANTVRGTGWWAGMVHAPSSILVSGKYEEQFYPLSFDRSQPVSTRQLIHRGAVFQDVDDATKRAFIPLTHILPEKVVTSDSTFKTNSFRAEL